MARHENLLLVRMLRYQGQLSDENLQVVLGHAEQATDHQDLLRRISDLGLVDPEWIERASRYLRSKARSVRSAAEELCRMDRSFGQLALSRGWIELADLETALLEQERLRRSNLSFRIGEILVRIGALDPNQVRDVLKEQGYDVLRCQQCDLVIEVDSAETACPTCGETLEAPLFLDVVRSDVTTRSDEQ